jgi:hypothetical protein
MNSAVSRANVIQAAFARMKRISRWVFIEEKMGNG